ncbi:MAG: hypothetical protein AABY34_05565 [Pseudomonadota bacterium]
MPTNNPRVNVTFDPHEMHIVSSLAAEERKSVSTLIKELTLEALEQREDQALSSIATVRDKKSAKRTKHNDAWK